MKEKPFNFRAFTALTIFWSFIIEALSGLVLYTVPSGRVADWSHWTFLASLKANGKPSIQFFLCISDLRVSSSLPKLAFYSALSKRENKKIL